jgi:type IV pilus assembly protein PilM
MAGFKRSASRRTVTGLDIEPGGIRAVEVTAAPGLPLVVERAAEAPLDPGVIRDGEVADVEALTEALKALFAEHKLDRRVRLGVAGQRIVVRTLLLPPITDAKQLETAVRFQAADEVPMPLDHAVLDHAPLGIVETEDGPRMRVLIVAARREAIDRLLAAVRGAGLRPEGIDLSAFAMVRALAAEQTAPVLHLAVGGLVSLAVAQGGECLFTRVIAGGVEVAAGEVAERAQVPIDEARAALLTVGAGDTQSIPPSRPIGAPSWDGSPELPAPDEIDLTAVAQRGPEPAPPAPPPSAPQPAESAAVHDVARRALAEWLSRIASEVRTTLDFHLRAAEPVEHVLLTGTGAAIPGFADALSERLGLPVQIAGVAVPDGLEPARFAVAAGLAVEELAA